MAEAKPNITQITLRPHRSLGSFGLKLVLGAIVAVNLLIAALCWAYHAWPVFGFLGLDVLLAFAGFWLNNRAAERREQIIIEGDAVRLLRERRNSRREMQFNRRWLRVELEVDEPRELVGRLFLVSHGRRTEIASFLGADERQALAETLKAAIIRPKI
ncbi:MAG: DUF2244 domain-containing protein [Alphaproteobacteria bacterium]|nr:DUF2244 domain-containing protein [Alphaproteobacteria bacterium]